MLKILALMVVLSIVALLLYAATKPDTFLVQRSASIKAPAEKIFPLINDLRSFNRWNPYEKKDPGIQGRYSGPSSGQGAAYAFEGNKEVGKGSIEIIEAMPPRKVTMKLNMLEPFEARNIVEFTVQPAGETTQVTWAMHGPSPFVAKLIGTFVNMDRMIGKDFEAGLANLKQVAES